LLPLAALTATGCAAVLGIDDVSRDEGAEPPGGGSGGEGDAGRGGDPPVNREGSAGQGPRAGEGGSAGRGGAPPEAGRGGAGGLGGSGGLDGGGGLGGGLPLPKIVINELYYNPSGADNDGRCFIELRGPAGASLEGFELVQLLGEGSEQPIFAFDATHATGASGYFLLVQNGSVTVAPAGVNSAVDNTGQGTSPDLINTANAVALRRHGVVVDAVAYSDELGQCPTDQTLGEGKCARARKSDLNQPEWSLSRLPDGSDTDRNSVDFVTSAPSGGEPNKPPLPDLP
jgi:hypothetical protein